MDYPQITKKSTKSISIIATESPTLNEIKLATKIITAITKIVTSGYKLLHPSRFLVGVISL
jgi:hypothetical protein